MVGGARAVFLDRDGVIVIPQFRDGRSFAPRKLEDFQIYPEAAGALNRLREAGFKLIVATNQPDIGNGVVEADVVAQMHAELARVLPLDRIEMCPHAQNEGCDCRKPAAGMLRRAARDLGISLADSFMVGDRLSDVEAGRGAGCRTIFIDRGYRDEHPGDSPDFTCGDVEAATNWILSRTPSLSNNPSGIA